MTYLSGHCTHAWGQDTRFAAVGDMSSWAWTPRQVVLLGERLPEVINAVDRQMVAHGL